MIDCGSSTFSRLIEQDILKGVNHAYVLMTHTHPDHIGSLGDLILYGYYSMGELMKPSVTVIYPDELVIIDTMRMMGVLENTYKRIKLDKYDYFTDLPEFKQFLIKPVAVDHAPELNCFGYIMIYNAERIYYSSDSNHIPDGILKSINNDLFDYIYQDTSKADYPGNVHLSLRELDELIVKDLIIRKKIYCMHLDGGFVRDEAEDMGFNVVANYKND